MRVCMVVVVIIIIIIPPRVVSSSIPDSYRKSLVERDWMRIITMMCLAVAVVGDQCHVL